ncbi:hypothetical protein CC80DRAFT_69997 [Byssothecium circinans]|uniref:RNase III domain-containing protein n=1 Tax=Byssothecium circinans TaxID=147558 RepID=A0A6A5TT71_9PLEO|nr:hypothetical protein CC80DRAFT_69997 [Byssothecium circinans]
MATPQSATRLVARRLNQPSARFRPRSIDHVTRLSMDPRLWEQTQLQNHGPPRTRAQKSIDQKLKIVEARVLGRKFNGVTLPKYEKPSQGEGEERKTRRNFLLAALESNRTYQKIYNWSRIEHFLLWINGFPRQHYGPSAVIPDLFVRRDLHYYHLENNKIKYLFPEPDMYHSIFDVGARVSKVEDIIGYKFKNKILCIEAIKLSGMNVPVYFDGILWPVRQNKRLALMGDRTLNMALCEMWYESGNSNSQYALMSSQVVARSALYATGKPLGFDESCFLMPPGSFKASQDQIAETFEAVVGAVYLDTGKQYDEVYKLIHRLGLDRHEALKTPEELEEEERLRVLGRRAKRRERREARKMEEAQTSVWQRLRELWSGKQGMHEGKDREKKGLKREEARLGVLERRAEKIEHGEMREEAGKTEAPTSVWQRLRKSWRKNKRR